MRGRWNRQVRPDGSLSDVNLTPLIDVSLVLVVILLLATPLAFESSFGLGRAAPTATAAAPPPVAEVAVDIVSSQRVEVNGRAVPLEDLAGALRPLLRQGDGRLSVACADRVNHGIFVRVLDIAKLNGATTIAVAGR